MRRDPATLQQDQRTVDAPEFRALIYLTESKQPKEERDVDVAREESARVPLEEHIEAVDEDEDRDPEDTPVRQPRLQRAVVDQLLAVEALRLEPAVCRRGFNESGCSRHRMEGRY